MTYQQIAKDEGIIICGRCLAGDICVESLKDSADIAKGILHWRERNVTKPGLRNFLKLCAAIRFSHNRRQPEWEKLHVQNAYAYRVARHRYRTILPKHLSRNDRAAALASMANVSPKPYPAHQWAKEVLR